MKLPNNISDFRKQYPQYNSVGDIVLTKKIYEKFKPTNNFDEFNTKFNNTQPKGGLVNAFGAGVDKLQETAYRAVKGFTDVVNEGTGFFQQDGALAGFAKKGIDTNIEEQKSYVPTVSTYKDIGSVGDAASYVGELTANSIPYMVAAMNPYGAAVLATGLSQEAYSKQPEGEKSATKAIVSGVAQMALERLGDKFAFGEIGKSVMKEGFIQTAKKFGKGELVDIAKDPKTALEFGKRVFYGALGEGFTEVAQESLAMWGAGKDFNEFKLLNNDPNNKNDILGSDGQRLMENFVGGFAVGGAIRTGTESAQRLIKWQNKSAPIAKNGINELVKQGVPQDEAVAQVRSQLIEAGVKQGLTEVESSAAAARTMKLEYGIDDEIFTPVANDVASRREALYTKLEKDRIEGGIVQVQDVLAGEVASTADELVQQQMQKNAPEFFNQLDEQTANNETRSVENNETPTTKDKTLEADEVKLVPSTSKKEGLYGWKKPKNGKGNVYSIQKNGEAIGFADISILNDGTARIEDIVSLNGANPQGTIGYTDIKKLLSQFKKENPQITKITGERVSGIRKSGKHGFSGTGDEVSVNLKRKKTKIKDLKVVEATVSELSLSSDVPQFKAGSNDKGVVEPLGGKFERTGVAPIQVWVRSNGDKEVISGRHRLDLAQRSGETTIPAQYHYEEDGFTKQEAAALDAVLNVREGQGKVKDYVQFIQQTNPTEKEANARGILARSTGRRAYTIANFGSVQLIAAHRRNNGLTDEGAVRIAQASPNNEALQAVGIKALNEGKSITVAENLVKAVKSMTNDQQQSSGDLFGFDDSAMIEAEALAKKASAKQAEIQRSLSAIQGAAKRPELAAKEGVNVKDPKAVNKRIEQLKEEKRAWDNWHTDPKLVEQLHDKPKITTKKTPEKTASQEAVSISESKSIDEAANEAATSFSDPKLNIKSITDFSTLKTPKEKAKAWFDLKSGDSLIDINGKNRGEVFETPKGRVVRVKNSKGTFEQINVVSIAGKDGVIKAVDDFNSNESQKIKQEESIELDAYDEVGNGKIFGEISNEVANEAGIQSGKIKLQIGTNKQLKGQHRFGLRHMSNPDRIGQLKKAGYDSPQALLSEVGKEYNKIIKGKGGTLLLAKVNGKAKIAFIELVKGKDGDFYTVNSGLVSRNDYLKNKTLLWERAQSNQQQLKAESPSAVSGNNKASIESIAPKDKTDKIEDIPNDGVYVGEINNKISNSIKRQAGKIKLNQGDQGQGYIHIEKEHGEQITGLGMTITDFIKDTAKNFNAIYRASGRQLLIAKVNGKDQIMFVRLEPSSNNDFYDVKSAFPVAKRTLKNKVKKGEFELLWQDAESPASDTSVSPDLNPLAENNTDSTELSVSHQKSSSDKSIAPKPKADKIESKDNVDKPLFSRSDSGTLNNNVTTNNDSATVSEKETHEVIDSIVNSDGSLLTKDHFVVVSTFDELPSEIKDAAKDQDAENSIGGVHHNGKTYLVRDKLANAQEVETTIFHETYGHYGIRQLFGQELPKVLNRLLQGIGGLNGLNKIAKKYGIDLSAYKKGLAQSSLTNEQAQTVLMDELLAHLAQDNKPSIKRMVKEAIGFIRQGLKKLGFLNLQGISDNELFYILRKARQAAQSNKANSGNDIRFSINEDLTFKPAAHEAENYRVELARSVKSLKSTVRPIKLGSTPKVLTALGAPNLDIYIRRDTVIKATNKAKSNHDVPMSIIEKLPELLADPVAVLRNKDESNSKIVLVDALTESGKAIIVPIHLQVNEGKLTVNRIESAYGIDGLTSKEVLYINESKSTNPELSRLVHMMIMGSNRKSQGSDRSIVTPKDIVNNSGVRFSQGSDIKESLTPKKQSDSLIANEDEGRINLLIRKFQDKFKPLKTTQEIIEKSGKKIAYDENAHEAEEAFHGKAEDDLRKMERDYVQPLIDAMEKHKISIAELDLYVIAKHAKERNADISRKNDAFDGKSGSGMTNDEAQAILDKAVFEGKRLQLEAVADKVYAMTKARRDLLNENGLISDVEKIGWDNNFKNYVPLKGFANDEVDNNNKAISRVGKGFAIQGRESMIALGRRSMAASPSMQVIQDLSESIIRNRKNEVGNAFLKLVKSNPNKDYWQVFTDNNPEIDRRFNKKSGQVEETKIPMAMMADKYFTTKVNGETQYIKINDDRLMIAMKNLGVDKVNSVTKTLGTVNRFLSTVNTSLNPEFVISNMARDIQTAVFNVMAEQDLPQGKIKGQNIATNMVKDWFHARKGIALSLANKKIERDSNGKPTTKAGEYQELYDQFREDGAKTGYFDIKDVNQQADDINHMLKMAGDSKWSAFLRGKKKFGDFVENINQAVENAVRLSAYKQALDAFGEGKEKGDIKANRQKAASLAKNLTVNFNRKGEVGTTLNALYMFANAGIQGSAQFLRSMQGYRDTDGNYKFTGAQKMAAVFASGAFALAAINRAFSDDDDDGISFWDKVPSYVKERNIVIMKSIFGIGKPGDYISIPLPYGYNMFSVLGTSAESVAFGNKTAIQAAGNVAGAMVGSFLPIGSQSSDSVLNSIAKTITPTIGQPIVQLALNENFYGGSIYRENYQFGTQKPNSALSKRNTNGAYKAVSSWLNEATGDSYYKSGVIDISPEVFKYFVDFTTGAAGSFVVRAATGAVKLAQWESIDDKDIIFYRKISGETNDSWGDLDKLYQRSNEIKQTRDEYKSLRGKERISFRKSHKADILMINHVKATEKHLRSLRKRFKSIEANYSLTAKVKANKLKLNRKQQDSYVDKFNLRYNELNK